MLIIIIIIINNINNNSDFINLFSFLAFLIVSSPMIIATHPFESPKPSVRRYSYSDLVAEMEETTQPHELWDGELVMSPTPSFFHQEIVFRFHRSLHDWVTPRQLGKVVAAPIDMVLSPHRVVQPDVAFVAAARRIVAGRILFHQTEDVRIFADAQRVDGLHHRRRQLHDLTALQLDLDDALCK